MKNAPIIFPLFGYEYFANVIHKILGYEIGKISIHEFPDEETVVRIDSPIRGAQILIIGSLDRPNKKIGPLLFAAETARELGAQKIGLIAPYLPYMRQDKQFHPGEGVTSKYFSSLISRHFDGLITIDPHLHRWPTLDAIYPIANQVLHATACIASWIKQHISDPVLIGPDIESRQWVSQIASKINAPFLILDKVRKGDQEVEVSIPQIELYRNCTPILVDDIISTAATMIDTVTHLKSLKMKPPLCIGVHPIFAGNAYNDLVESGADRIVSCNTINHPSNEIDVSELIANSLAIFDKKK